MILTYWLIIISKYDIDLLAGIIIFNIGIGLHSDNNSN